MIDIFRIFNFQSQPLNCVNSFLEAYHNYVPDYNLREIKFDCGNIFYTERKESPFPYFHKTTHIFIFGTVFMRQDYNNAKLGNQKVLLPQDLLDFYDRFSVEMAKYIKGNFAIIIYDDHRKELVFISSKLNTLPLFYYYKNNNFIFSSSIKAMLNFIDIQPKLNEKSLVEQAIFYYPLSDKTYLNDILQLPPATVLKIDKNELKAKKYWQIEDLFYKEQLIKEDDALYKCMDLMKENLKVYTSCDKKFLLSLTAGFDSRTNLALIDRDPKDFLCY